jgi:hypothetical protein
MGSSSYDIKFAFTARQEFQQGIVRLIFITLFTAYIFLLKVFLPTDEIGQFQQFASLDYSSVLKFGPSPQS